MGSVYVERGLRGGGQDIKADRAAVALARAVIEASAKDKGVVRGSLVAKVDQLHSAGLLRGHIKEAAHEVRFDANEAAHGDLSPIEHEAAEEILTLMGVVLNDLFQSPARVERARQRRLEQASEVEAVQQRGTATTATSHDQ